MSTPRPLTARGVKVILTRAGIDHSVLEITNDYTVWVSIETGQRSTSVIISGLTSERRAAAAVLYDKGLSNAPYPEYDSWSRPGGVAGPPAAEPADTGG